MPGHFLTTANFNRKALDQLISDLREAQGDNLASIVLYGATATAEDDHRSDHNVLVVLRAAGFDDLRSCSRALSRWHDAGEPPPVIFTTDELESAADVFPIEFLQMEQARKILHGSDPFASLKISSDNLRHQTEQSLEKYVSFVRRQGYYAEYWCALGTDAIDELERLAHGDITLDHPIE